MIFLKSTYYEEYISQTHIMEDFLKYLTFEGREQISKGKLWTEHTCLSHLSHRNMGLVRGPGAVSEASRHTHSSTGRAQRV